MNDKTVKIPNISCHHCVATIKTELESLKGVAGVEGNPQTWYPTRFCPQNCVGGPLGPQVFLHNTFSLPVAWIESGSHPFFSSGDPASIFSPSLTSIAPCA